MTTNNMTVETYQETPQLGVLRGDWCRLQNHPNIDWEHFLLYLEHQGSSSRPWVMAVKNDKAVECIVAGRIEADRVAADLGYWTPSLGRITSLKVLTDGVLGPMSADAAASVTSDLCRNLTRSVFDRVILCNIRTDHPLAQAARNAPKRFFPMLLANPQTHWRKILPNDVAAFWAGLSRKHRYWLKRLAKKLDEDFPKAVSYETLKEPAQTDAFCEIAEQVAKKTFQRGLGVGFKNDNFFRSRCRMFAAKGCFRGYVLRLGGVPRAFWMGCIYGDTFHSEYTGYDPELRDYEVGSLLLTHVMEELIREGVRLVDFGLGSAFYKQRFGSESWEECDVVLYAPTFRNRIIAMSATSVRQLRSLAMKLPFVDWIKRVWRHWAAQQASRPGSDASE